MHSVAIRLVHHALLALSALAITASLARGQSECYVADYNAHYREPVSQVVVRADTAFVALGRCLDVVNVADPSAPIQISRSLFPDVIRDIALNGDTAYLAAHRHGLRVVDISSLGSPQELGALRFGFISSFTGEQVWQHVERVAVTANDHALVGFDNATRVYRIDVSDPTALVVTDSLYTRSSQAVDIETLGTIAFIAETDSVLIAESPGSTPLQMIGAIKTTYTQDMFIADSMLFIADLFRPEGGGGTLRIIDLSNPDSTQEIGSTDTAFGYEIGVDNGIAVTGSTAIEVFDVSIPTDPQHVANLDPFLPPNMNNNPGSVTVAGTTAFIGHLSEGLFLFDLSDPAMPSLVGRYGDVGTSSSVANSAGHKTLSLSVYPNPAQEISTVEIVLQKPDHVTVSVYDLLGRHVHRLHDAPLPAGVHTFQHRVEALPAGTYLVRADASKASVSTTFVRIR